MATSPMGISSITQRKFWSNPEGVVTLIVAALVAGVGIYTWSIILPFLLAMAANTLSLVAMVAVIGAILYAPFSPRVRILFRLVMRKFTNIIYTIDPIGVTEDKLSEMRKRREKLDSQIQSVGGQLGVLRQTIDDNHKTALKKMGEAAFAQKQVAGGKVQGSTALQYSLQVKVLSNKAKRREDANISYQTLLTKIQGLYDFLIKWAVHLDAYIDDTQDEVEEAQKRYKVVNTAFSAFSTAAKIMKGNATEEELYNGAMQFMADESTRKLGEITDFQRVADGVMNTMDIQNGSISEDALTELDAYESKLLTPGNSDTAFLLPGANAIAQPVAIRSAGSGVAQPVASDDYGKLFS